MSCNYTIEMVSILMFMFTSIVVHARFLLCFKEKYKSKLIFVVIKSPVVANAVD